MRARDACVGTARENRRDGASVMYAGIKERINEKWRHRRLFARFKTGIHYYIVVVIIAGGRLKRPSNLLRFYVVYPTDMTSFIYLFIYFFFVNFLFRSLINHIFHKARAPRSVKV